MNKQLDLETENEIYQRAPFCLIEPNIVSEIKKRLYFDDPASRQIMFRILGWNYDKINELQKTGIRDPLQEFFNSICMYEPQCVITCEQPIVHFRAKKCFPLKQVIQTIKAESNVADILLQPFVKASVLEQVQTRLNLPNNYPNAREFQSQLSEKQISFDLYHRKPKLRNVFSDYLARKKNVLVVDLMNDFTSIYQPINDSEDDLDSQIFQNLMLNLTENYRIACTPTKLSDKWNEFVQLQFKEAAVILVIANQIIEPNPSSLDDSLNSCAMEIYDDRQKFLIYCVKQTKKIAIGVCFNKLVQEDLENNFITPVFLVPQEIDNLLNFIDIA